MEATCCSETSSDIQRSTRRYRTLREPHTLQMTSFPGIPLLHEVACFRPQAFSSSLACPTKMSTALRSILLLVQSHIVPTAIPHIPHQILYLFRIVSARIIQCVVMTALWVAKPSEHRVSSTGITRHNTSISKAGETSFRKRHLFALHTDLPPDYDKHTAFRNKKSWGKLTAYRFLL
jgi:hypothetical protein